MTSSFAWPMLLLLGAVACTGSREPAPSAGERASRVATGNTEGQAEQSAPKPGASCERGALVALISAPHDVPTLESVRGLCAEPGELLARIAEDENERGLTRLRAIDLLGGVGGEASVSCLARLSSAAHDLASVRRSALVALGRATPRGDLARERAAKAALVDPDQHVRAAAAALLER